MVYQLHAANGQDLRATVNGLKQVLAAGSEVEAVEGLRALTNKADGRLPNSPASLQ